MTPEQYEFDVAFSFLAKDESLATQLDELLRSRLKTFLYSKRQEEVGGTDGEVTFNAIFGKKARVVVVLYRDGWGKSPWTRIEETAIRNRGYDHGYDFALFIPLDEPPTVPEWLPRHRLWVGLLRWGLEGAASVIEARVQEMGGEPHEESVVERASRLDQSLRFEAHRKQFLNSVAGVMAADAKFASLQTKLGELVAEVKERTSSIPMELKSARQKIVILGFGLGLSVDWRPQFSNSLDDARLSVELWEGHPPMREIDTFEPPRKLRTMEFTFDLLPSDHSCWRESGNGGRPYTSKELAEYLLNYFMEEGSKVSPRRGRR